MSHPFETTMLMRCNLKWMDDSKMEMVFQRTFLPVWIPAFVRMTVCFTKRFLHPNRCSVCQMQPISLERYRVIVMSLSGSGPWTLSTTMHLTRMRMMEEDRSFVYTLAWLCIHRMQSFMNDCGKMSDVYLLAIHSLLATRHCLSESKLYTSDLLRRFFSMYCVTFLVCHRNGLV